MINFSYKVLYPKIDNSRLLTFFISGKYDFQKKSWCSGYFDIYDEDWSKSNYGEHRFPVLLDRLLLVYRKRDERIDYVLFVETFCSLISDRKKTWGSDHWGALNCEDCFQELKFVQISSNHLSSLANCTIFSISKNSTNFEFIFLDSITKQHFADLLYVPTTKSELLELMKKIEASNLQSPTRKDFETIM